MRTYIYADHGVVSKFKTSRSKIEEIIRKIARGTDTRSLVVVVHLRDELDGWSGSFFPGSVNARRLVKMRGPWRRAHNSGVPPRLPAAPFRQSGPLPSPDAEFISGACA